MTVLWLKDQAAGPCALWYSPGLLLARRYINIDLRLFDSGLGIGAHAGAGYGVTLGRHNHSVFSGLWETNIHSCKPCKIYIVPYCKYGWPDLGVSMVSG